MAIIICIYGKVHAQNISLLSNEAGSGLAYVYVETETMDVQPPFIIADDAGASCGAYIYTPREPGVCFDFDITREGEYTLWARISNGGAGFRVFADGELMIKWRQAPASAAWHWTQVADPQTGTMPLVFEFDEGRHSIALEYAHNMDEPFGIDMVLLTDNPGFDPGRFVYQALENKPDGRFHLMEGENARIKPPFETGTDPNASNGGYLVLNCYHTTKQVSIPYDGKYKVWGRAMTPTGNMDSFFIGIGTEGKVHSWNNIGKKDGQWNWDYLRDRNQGEEMVIFELKRGLNVLRVKQREGGAMLDRILITNDMDFIPED